MSVMPITAITSTRDAMMSVIPMISIVCVFSPLVVADGQGTMYSVSGENEPSGQTACTHHAPLSNW